MDAFDSFLKQRIEKRRKSADVLADLKKTYFQARMIEVLKELYPKEQHLSLHAIENNLDQEDFFDLLKDLGISIITIRTAFNKDSKLLKPIATFPEQKLKITEKLAFQHTPQKFKKIKEALEGIHHNYSPQSDEVNSNGSIHFSSCYKTDGNYKKYRKNKKNRFDYRIDKAYSMMKDNDNNLSSQSMCFFSVKAKPINKRKFRISQIIAIYNDASIDITNTQLEKAHYICQTIFEEIDQIKLIDNELFELEGHELTSMLQPLFLDENIAPADKISFSIERLKSLLKRHLKSHYPSTSDIITDIYFVALAYEVDEEKPEVLTPRFQVYPHIYRAEFPYGSFIIGHPKRPSVAKYLLRNYFNSYKKDSKFSFVVGQTVHGLDPSIRFSDDFMTDMFKTVDTKIKEVDLRKLLENKDQIFISKLSNSRKKTDFLWKNLNVDVQKGASKRTSEKNNSILAYVIEGHNIDQHRLTGNPHNYKQLPRAILAIEGTQPEFLSNQERKSLRIVVEAFSHMVRHVFHANTLLDYRPQLSSAYKNYSHTIIGESEKSLANRFILSSMSIDVLLFSSILDHAEEIKEYESTLLIELRNIQSEVFIGTELKDEQVNNSEIVKDRLNQRFTKAVKFIQSKGNTPSEKAVHFIDACPRNFAWAGYTPSLAQALGDRADHSPPKFELMTAGFSAAGLYMALVRSEIRQVAKLSSVKKLKRERNNYKKYVRYKVLAAARSPSNAFAFDSTGQHGQLCGVEGNEFIETSSYEEKCYGVLVSDLASARELEPKIINGHENPNDEKVNTFLDKVAIAIEETEDVTEEAKERSKKTSDQIIESIISLFGNNLGHWYSTPIPSNDLKGKTTRGILLDGYRLNYKEKIKNDKLTVEEQGKEESMIVFSRLLNGHKDTLICNQEEVFPFKKYSLEPEDISAFINYKYRAPGPIELLYEKDSIELLSIAHRDLNARNLVWAGPIQSLMMIDFEHVGLGFWGMDQARLAVSTVVDILSIIGIKRTKNGGFDKRASSLEKAANFIISQWSLYGSQTEADMLKSKNIFTTTYKEITEDFLKGVIQHIIRETWRAKPEILLKESHFGIFQACLGYAIVKEYEYSIINVRRLNLEDDQISFVNRMFKYHKTLKEQLIHLYESEYFHSSTPQAQNELAAISKYVLAYYILKNIFKDLDFSKK